MEDGFLKVVVEDDYVYDMLTEAKNFAVLKRTLNGQDLKIDLMFEKRQKNSNKAEEDILKLKKLAGEFLDIKGE